MARNLDASCRLCRREGMKLFLKGIRCIGDKCGFTRRGYAPGQHGKLSRKLSNYGLQLREKQKVKRMYGILERQFRRYFTMASKTKGVTGKVLIQLLERRIDNVLLRAGFAASHAQARQIVRHGHVYVNNRRINIPSYLVENTGLIEIRAKEKPIKNIRETIELTKDWPKPSWLDIDNQNLKLKVLRFPEKEDLQLPVQEQLIVELYSK
ncbi:MAG: 30S ribosomal protein S4 [Candidatus Omnitrophica bacterium CG11_big_fil_rev_8_21_14_0_20_42_13]|uniref:Small ribosomal subunit protein uS4 n=1 Tax=Candidatus Ghiorseimicrobium undicola TaxID=1974746 RepID=A0A2H0LVG0_9BACT|nr:MAG: 30S ribosomal protein S4 [Candidatus Omnitrophica bacterium CG11_big_fil_rev_8_21_14_0_20_42_13]